MCRFFLATSRPEYSPDWSRNSDVVWLGLEPLSDAAIHGLLDSVLGSDQTLKTIKSKIVASIGGTPLFLEEVTRSLVESGAVDGEVGQYRAVAAHTPIAIPSTVEAVLSARIDRLPAQDKMLLQRAAVIGRTVPFSIYIL